MWQTNERVFAKPSTGSVWYSGIHDLSLVIPKKCSTRSLANFRKA